FTIAPCRARDRDLTMRNLVRVEGMSLEAMRAGIDWSFESFPEYMDRLQARGVGPNVAAFVGHSSLRTYVMGEDAPRRAARAEEVAEMRRLVVEAMGAGAIGFATSTSPSHNGAGGEPMPSRLADEHEMRALVGALGEVGRGIFMLTKGGETTIPFLESLAADTGRPVMIAALLHNATRPEAVFDDLEAIAAAQARGRALWGQVSCCPLTLEFTLRAPYPLEGIRSWAPAMRAEGEALRALYADPAFRAAVRRDLEEPIAVRLFNGEWHKLRVVEVAREANRHLEGKSLADIAREAGRDPLACMLDLALAEDLDTLFVAELLNSDEDAVARLIRHPASSVALSDAGAHLTFFCDAGFGLRLLGYWSRDRGVLPLEAAVHALTAAPADIFGIRDRGRLVPGAWADLMLFDPDTVDRGPNRRVHDLPSGAARLVNDARGLVGVWVNGVRVCADGRAVPGAGTPGQLLRGFST
ncbi:MAG: amidohydrolase family protein, partial [Ectothiorhodospiraceae bacterium]|nr:amidohydrolase family protein [Ectothiorhodospiraceae bacterium]